MARRKRAVALFEVIHQAKPYEQKLTPRPVPKTIIPPTAPRVPTKPTKPLGEVIAERLKTWQAAAATILNPIQGRIKTFVVQQGSILAGAAVAFAVIGLVSLARHRAQPNNSAVAALQQLRTQPAHPDVLQIDTAQTVNAEKTAPAPVPHDSLSSDIASSAQPAAAVNTPDGRQFNLNYILVQSYADEKTANLAADFLNKNGVPCTVERQIKNWRRDFYYVVGLKGFTRASGSDYVAYRKSIETLSTQFAKSTLSYKRFEPMAIKWLPLN